MPPPSGADLALPAQQVEELVKVINKGLRAFQMYPPNNPMYQRSQQAIQEAFLPIWSTTPQLVFTVTETDLIWEEQVVYHQPTRGESLSWMLYKDGMRMLRFRPGVEAEEVVSFLQVVTRARLLPGDAADDLLTLLWEQEFLFIDYQFAESVSDGAPALEPHPMEFGGAEPEAAAATNHQQVVAEVVENQGLLPEADEFDSTLYFLEPGEVRTLADQVAHEYSRDVRQASFDALLDTFELQPSPAIRGEVLDLFDQLFPNLLNRGEFRSVAQLLREFRTIAQRITVLDPALRKRLESFQASLSEPAILAQLLQALEDSTIAFEEEDIGMVLGELHAQGLETMLTFLPSLKRPAVRQILEQSVDRLGAVHVETLLSLLSNLESEALPGAIALTGRLKLGAAVPALDKLLAHREASARRAAIQALGAIGSPGALAALEKGLEDPDRVVRLASVTLVVERGYRGALRRIETVVMGKGEHDLERAERRQFFEAYAILGGPAVLPQLGELIEPKGLFRRKESTEVRTCAAYAVARIQVPEARQILERLQSDKDLPVRNAAAGALRNWRA